MVIHVIETYFLKSCQRISASPSTLPTSSFYFLLESRTQIATGSVVHCVCFSLLPGQLGEGDKMATHSPRRGWEEKANVTFQPRHIRI